MGSAYNEPPSKKRRFLDEPATSSPGLNSSPALPKRRCSQEVEVDEDLQATSQTSSNFARFPLSEKDVANEFNRSPVPLPSSSPSPPSTSFDQDTFESFIGDKVQPDVLKIIRERCGDNIERAVNMYLDGTWKQFKKTPASRVPSRTATLRVQETPNLPKDRSIPEARHVDAPDLPKHRSMLEARYVGAFGVQGWASRSGALLKHGDVVKIERQVPSAKNTISARGAATAALDIVVRFSTTSGREIGRLDKNTASWVSTLLDQKVCKFEATCAYAPERIRTGDDIFLQLKAFILPSAFLGRGFQVAENGSAGRYEHAESLEERSLRIRQVALVKLFQSIDLVPSRGNAAAAKHQRDGLIEAAELKAKGSSKSTPSQSDEDGDELEQDQLDSLYKKAQSFDLNTPEAEPADTFAMELRPYQKQALHWMMAKEKDERNRESSMHPLWEEYVWPVKDLDGNELPQVDGQPCFYTNPYSGDLSLDFPVQEQHCLGGILADEMGLGKTIQMLSLVHSHRPIQARQAGSGSVNQIPRLPSIKSGVVNAPCTLVVAPMSLLTQWQSEAEKASKEGTLKSMVYYGSDKNVDLRTLCCEANAASAPDVLITSYGTVLSEFTQIARNGGDRSTSRALFSLNFFRIILDEAHHIKNRQSKTARACYELAAEHRWALTGTPIVNRLEDLFSLVRFLRVEPWNNFSFWRTFITVPFESKNFVRALDVVQTVLEPLVMRRTKDMKTPNGEPLVPLPAKLVEFVDVELSKEERDVYDYIFARARRTFQDNVKAGTVMKAFTSIFAQILRLRQSCCHPLLVRNQEHLPEELESGGAAAADAAAGLADDMDLNGLIEQFTAVAAADDESEKAWNATFGAHALQQIRDDSAGECPICAEEPMIEQTVTPCWHSACKKCLLDYIKHETDRHEVARCFQCREPIKLRDLFEMVHEEGGDMDPAHKQSPRISLHRLGVNSSSAKVGALLGHLRTLRREHPRMKSVVFSQFTSFLSLIEPALTRADMKFLRLDGTITQKARAKVLEDFAESDRFTILLLSLKAGGVGLNLTSAKRVYMMDPWWSFAVEAQAIDRVHRMGQVDEVKVYRFIVKSSVEERMLKVQDRKKFIATSLGMMNDEEKRMQRIEDIKELLS